MSSVCEQPGSAWSRWAGVPRRWRARSAATGAPAAGTCGARTPLGPRRGKLSRAGPGWALEGIATRFEGVAVIGVDEHVRRHTRKGDKYVTVIIDLAPIRTGGGPARLLDMVEGRPKAAF